MLEAARLELWRKVLTLETAVISAVMAGSGSRLWSSSKECWVIKCSKALSLTGVASELKASNGTRLWSSSHECRLNERSSSAP